MRSLFVVFALLASAALPASASPWSLQVRHDSRGSGVSMGYSLRWGGPARPSGGGQSLVSSLRAIVQSARFDLYGVRVAPFRRLAPSAEPTASGRAAASAEAGDGALGLASSLGGLQSQAGREMRRWLVRAVFDRALPKAKSAPLWQKEAVAADLLDAGRSWTAD